MSDTKKFDVPQVDSNAVASELSDDQLGNVSGGNSACWHLKEGQTWEGKCPVCKKKTTHTCIHNRVDDCFNYTWWQCGECGSVRRWDPGFLWASWNSTIYENHDDALLHDNKW